MNGWKILPLEQCMEAIIDYRGKTPAKTTSGVPLITAKIVKGGRIEEPSEFIAHEDFESWMTRGMPKAGDVVLTTEAPLGEVGQIDDPHVALAQRIITLRGKSGLLDNTYLKFALQSDFVRSQLLGRASGSTVSGIKQSELRTVDLPIPSFDEQVAIGKVLGSLDDKIELNRRMNETLEAMARALFKDWLFDFRPERAKVADLIKEGVLEIGDGYRAKNSELGRPGLPFIRAGDLSSGFDTKCAGVLSQSSVEKAGSKRSRPGDVAFTSKGTIGRFARVTKFTQPLVYSPQVCFWRSLNHERLEPAILYCWMTSEDMRSQIDAVAGQTDMAPYVSLRDQREMEVPVFSTSQTSIARQLDALLLRQAVAAEESRSLAALRDTLLPKLLSGEVGVKADLSHGEQIAALL